MLWDSNVTWQQNDVKITSMHVQPFHARVVHLQGGEHRLHDLERCQQLEAAVALHLQYTIQ